MQVILLEPVKRLGQFGDQVKVRDGFGRNFLIPQGKALRATKDNIAYFEAKRADIEKDNEKRLKEATKVGEKLEGQIVTLIRQAGEDGRLFGSVSANDIAKAVADTTKQEVSKRAVQMVKAIKYLGIYPVTLQLHGAHAVQVLVNIGRSDTEAQEAISLYKQGKYVSYEDMAAAGSQKAAAMRAEQEVDISELVDAETAAEIAEASGEKADASEEAAEEKSE